MHNFEILNTKQNFAEAIHSHQKDLKQVSLNSISFFPGTDEEIKIFVD